MVFEHEALKGYTQLNKDHLITALCKVLNLPTHAHHEAHGIDCILSVDRDFEAYRAASGKPLRNLVTLPPARRSKPRSVR